MFSGSPPDLPRGGGWLLPAIFVGSFILLSALEMVSPSSMQPPARRRRWPVNFALTALFVLVKGLFPVTLIAAAELAARRDMGVLNLVDLPLPAGVMLTLLTRSLTAYGTHRLMHAVPWLWRIHRIHHLDPALDVSTAARFHPLEPVLINAIAIAVILLLGLDPLAVLIYELAEAALAIFSHANVRLPAWLDRGLGWALVTPDLHRLHHSPMQHETDSNFGSTLSIWDWLFGTYRRKPREALARQHVGLDECADARASSLLWLLVSPVTGTGWRRREAATREGE